MSTDLFTSPSIKSRQPDRNPEHKPLYKVIEIRNAADPEIKDSKYGVTVLSEEFPIRKNENEIIQQETRHLFPEFFNGDIWIRIKDAKDYEVSDLSLENLSS